MGLALSERKGGNSDQLLTWALKGCEQAGASVQRIDLREHHINPCRACDACLKKGVCVLEDDDFNKLLDRILSADRLILAIPLYFMGLPSRGKALVDRCQSMWNRKYRLDNPPAGNPDRRALVLMVGGARTSNMFYGVRLTLRAFFDVIGYSYWLDLTFPGVDQPGDLSGEMETDVMEAGMDLAGPVESEAT